MFSSLPPSSAPQQSSPFSTVCATQSLHSLISDDFLIDIDSAFDGAGVIKTPDSLTHGSNHENAVIGSGSDIYTNWNPTAAYNVLGNQQYIRPADLELVKHVSGNSSPDTNPMLSHTEPGNDAVELVLHREESSLPSSDLLATVPLGGIAQSRHRRPRKRSNTPIKDWFIENVSSPYPDQAQLSSLATASKLSVQQVRNCLSNLRARMNPVGLGLRAASAINFPLSLDNPSEARLRHNNEDFSTIPSSDPIPIPSEVESSLLAPNYHLRDPSLSSPNYSNSPQERPSIKATHQSTKTQKRKGKRRHPPRAIYSSSGTHLSFTPFDSGSDATKAFHCTVCSKTFRDAYNWKRHEIGVHNFNSVEWTCMLDDTVIMAKMKCVFCSDIVKDFDHHFDQHDMQICLNKDKVERTFMRKDLLKQHVQHVHLATGNEYVKRGFQVPEAWSKESDMTLANSDAAWCGFCQRMFDTTAERMEHVAQHFRDGMNMMTWSPRPGI